MQDLFKRFDRAVVIGLHRIPEFYKSLGLDWCGWESSGVELFPAIDARNCKPPPSWGNEIPGLWACGESHRQVIARALSDGIGSILIMEDDCRFVPGADAIFADFITQIPNDWQALMLGGQIAVEDGKTTRISQHVSRCDGHVERLHCYALNREGMQIYHDVLCEQTAEPNDYRWGRIQAEGKLRVYRIEPFIAYQAAGRSAISGRVEANRIWDDRVDVRLRDPRDIPIISLVCPFAIMERLRDQGIIANGGESPPFMEHASVEQTETYVAEVMLASFDRTPDIAKAGCDRLLNDTAFHRDAVFALWHPSEPIPHERARVVRADSYESAVEQIRAAANNPAREEAREPRNPGEGGRAASPVGLAGGRAHQRPAQPVAGGG